MRDDGECCEAALYPMMLSASEATFNVKESSQARSRRLMSDAPRSRVPVQQPPQQPHCRHAGRATLCRAPPRQDLQKITQLNSNLPDHVHCESRVVLFSLPFSAALPSWQAAAHRGPVLWVLHHGKQRLKGGNACAQPCGSTGLTAAPDTCITASSVQLHGTGSCPSPPPPPERLLPSLPLPRPTRPSLSSSCCGGYTHSSMRPRSSSAAAASSAGSCDRRRRCSSSA